MQPDEICLLLNTVINHVWLPLFALACLAVLLAVAELARSL